MSQKIKTSVEIDGSLTASQIANATTDTDKFLVSDGGTVKYRTGAELASDLGIASGSTSKVQHQVKAGVAINKGQAVYVTSADGTNMIVGLASNASEATSSKTMGLLNATVVANGFADVITEGLLDGLDTSTATIGNPVWLGTGGNLIYGLANKPYAPNHLVFIGIVTRVNANNGEIFVKVQNGFELDEIHDVDLKTTTKVNGHLLGYNGSLWVNKTVAEWLGYTPYNASNPAGYISSYTETDTLASVTARGALTNTPIAISAGTLNHVTLGDRFNLIGGSNLHITNNAYYDSGFKYKFADLATKLALQADGILSYQTAVTGTVGSAVTFDTKFSVDSSGNLIVPGTLTASGYNKTNWDTAYGWGNHASAGYATSGHTHGLGRHNLAAPALIDSLTTSNFRSTFFGTSANDYQISTARFNSIPAPFSGLNMYGTAFAWSGADTHGFLAVDYIGAAAIIGGGNGQNINWTKRLAFLDDAVPTSRTITINGTSYDLSANRSWTVTASETDTLATVTARGNTTTASITAASVIIPSFETAANVLSFRSGIPDGTNVGIRAKATVTANRDGLELLGYNGIDFSINNGNTVAGKFNNYGQFLVNAASSGYGANLYGYNLGMRGNTSQAYMSIALSNQTLDTQGLIVGIDTGYARFHVRDSKPISFANGDVERMTLDTSANLIANGSVRTPIFYDSNNTGFYGDFASTSNFNKLLLNSENSFNTTTPGLTSYGLTLMGGTSDYANGITWTWGNTNSQAGVYVQSSGAYGTKMYFATTDSFATGAKTAMAIDHSGNVSLNRGTFSNGSVWINNGVNYNSYNENIRLFNATNGVSVIAFGASGTSGTPQSSILGFSDRLEIRVGSNGTAVQRNYDNYVEAMGSYRAPIFYDSNDTAYYVNANGESRLDTINSARFASDRGSQNPDSSHPGFGIRPFYSWNLGQAYNSSAGYSNGITIGSHPGDQSYGFQIVQNMWDDQLYFRRYNGGWQGWRTTLDNSNYSGYSNFGTNSVYGGIFYDGHNTGYYVNPDGTSNMVNISAGGYIYAASYLETSGPVYGTIFYDNNNRAYYMDPNGTSRMGTINSDLLRSYSNLYLDSDYGRTVVGVYSSYRFQGVFAMGDSYKLATDGTSCADHYGIAWSHPNAGGQAANLSSHGALIQISGITRVALSTNIWCQGDIIAYSDARVKDNVQVIDNPLERLKKVRGVTFTRNDLEDKEKRYAGVIAQEMIEALPEVVTENADGHLSVSYGNSVSLLIECIKEQQTQIEELKELVNKLINK